MCKSILGVVVIIGVLILTTPAEAVITFERAYEGGHNEDGFSVQETQDGGYIILGDSYWESFPNYTVEIYLIKTDSLGDTVWTKTHGSFNHVEVGYSVQETPDGGYIIAGENDWKYADGHTWLVKTDVVGDTVWTKEYDAGGWNYGHSVQVTQDGGYIIAGGAKYQGVTWWDVYLIKTDAVGATVWTGTYGGGSDDKGYSVQQTTDGGYIIAGTTESFSVGFRDVYLIKTDSIGGIVWTRTYGGIDDDCGYSVQVTQDGGYIIAGGTHSFGAGSYDVYLIKTDATGDTVWTKTYGGTDIDCGYSVQVTQDGGYIVAGRTETFGAGDSDVYLIKTDATGDTVWTRTYGAQYFDRGYSVQVTQDGGYIIVGSISSWSGLVQSDVYLIKTDALGNVGIEEETASVVPELYGLSQNQPNPFSKATSINYWVASQEQRVTLKIYDVTGKLVKTLVNEQKESGYYVCIWDGIDDVGKKVPNGIYFMRLKAGDYHKARKLLVVR